MLAFLEAFQLSVGVLTYDWSPVIIQHHTLLVRLPESNIEDNFSALRNPSYSWRLKTLRFPSLACMYMRERTLLP